MYDKLFHLYDFVDRTMADLFARFPTEVVCRQGCADCCHAVFDLSFIEASCLFRHFRELNQELQKEILDRCAIAAAQWQELFRAGTDPSSARIRCPLLSDAGLCCCYATRPVNCRTYGVPTIINGAAHVCGISNFARGISYPAIDLAPLQKSLYDYSVSLAGASVGARRWSIAHILLQPELLTLSGDQGSTACR